LALVGTTFVIAAIVSLATSWLLVTRLERVGERFGFSEALLGIVAALAANAPEITSSITALSQHQRTIGAGVVIGSNVFNLAALLGVAVIVSGFVALNRRVVILGGAVAMWVAFCCIATVTGATSTFEGLALAAFVFAPYLVVLGLRRQSLWKLPLPRRWLSWLSSAVDAEERELAVAIRPQRGRPIDAIAAAGSLIVVVLASIAMERAGAEWGHRFHIADAVIGGIVLAAVTSLPNTVAALHFASKGRGSAAFSIALNSNNLNVVVGLLIPGAIIGLAAPSVAGTLTAASYVVLTGLVLTLAFAKRGLSWRAGLLVIAGYGVFVVWLLAIS
jgi:cation:H+ antiporter